jgi:D-alanine-D-alanine ligase
MNVLIVHNPLADLVSLDDADVLTQTRVVGEALLGLGHTCTTLAWPEDMHQAREIIQAEVCDVTFNLVESIRGSARTAFSVPALLEKLGMPFTGGSSWSMRHSTSKLLTKAVLAEHGLPTPAWLDMQGQGSARTPGRFIVKSVWEHASFGLDEDNVISAFSRTRLLAEMNRCKDGLGGECFAEEFIPGREFNLALLERDGQPLGLAPAEILFTGYAEDKPRIVDYRAKWREQSVEYQNTKRCLEFSEMDFILLHKLSALAERCWRAFDLSGYARVDLRVDAAGRPWIIDVNANPCLSPDAGFQASSAASGLSFPDVVNLLLQAAVLKNHA